MKLQISSRWEESDLNTYFVIPFIDAREAIEVTYTQDGSRLEVLPNLDKEPEELISGDNWFWNLKDRQELEFVVNGRNTN